MTKEEIEKIFSSSNSQDEIFDAFNEAINKGIEDINLYQILLANKTLSCDEIKLYAKKIADTFPELANNIYLFCANLFSNLSWSLENVTSAIDCLEQALNYNDKDNSPIIELLNLYSHDLDLPSNKRIIEIIKKFLPKIENKSETYSAISKFYGKAGKERLERKYARMAAKYKQ